MNKAEQKNGAEQNANHASNTSKISLNDVQTSGRREEKYEAEDERYINDNGSFRKRIKRSSWILTGVALASILLYSNINTSKSVQSSSEVDAALESHISATLGAGTKILSDDQTVIGQDYTITHDSEDTDTVLWIWDYAAEDGDYVQILVDGAAICDPFMIKNKAVSFIVPTAAEVQVIGTRDGGGGITYGVYCELNQTSYFNGMEEGNGNTYTLIRE